MIRSLLNSLALPITAAVVLTAAPVFAASMNTRPVAMGSGGAALQSVMDSITTSGPGIDVNADQHNAALFTSGASGGAVATFVIELAGFASGTSFGLYEDNTTSNRAEIFSGADTAGDQKLVSFLANGDVLVNGVLAAAGVGSKFGFYIDVDATSKTYFTEDDENGGFAHALVYEGDDATTLAIDPFAPGLFSSSEYIIAFEDLDIATGVSDMDYTDLVVLVESVHAVPVPAAALAGIPMLGLMGLRQLTKRRRA